MKAEPLSFKSLRDPEHEYLVKVSDALYWVGQDAYLDELDHWEGQCQVNQHEIATDFIKDSDQSAVFFGLSGCRAVWTHCPFVGAGFQTL